MRTQLKSFLSMLGLALLLTGAGCTGAEDVSEDVEATSAASGGPCNSPLPCTEPQPGTANNAKTCASCPTECGPCPSPGYCGDGICGNSLGESLTRCPQDCVLP